MGYVIFCLGGVLLISGLIVQLLHFRACQRIVRATSWRVDGLTWAEAFININQLRKRRKLSHLAANDVDESVRDDARRALRLETVMYSLFLPGLLLLGYGAMLGSRNAT